MFSASASPPPETATTALEEKILSVMDRKDHWAWPWLTRPGLSREQLATHFRHEYQTYVRDFPVLLSKIFGQGPPDDVRAALAENIFEEQTGKLSLGVSHPSLFLEMMDGLGIERRLITTPGNLAPEAIAYRAFLDEVAGSPPWVIGAAVLTIFVEGSVHERLDLSGKRAHPPIEEAVMGHPMVKHYGCPPERLRLLRAHRMVEPDHRKDAWRMVLGHANGHERAIVRAVSAAHDAWSKYRDGVARLMGLTRQMPA